MGLSLLARPRCSACDVPLALDAALCGGCLATLEPAPPLTGGLTASFSFGGALVTVVHRAKYDDRLDCLRALERLVIERLPAPDGVDVVVPVALHVARLRERGFDQAARLARAVSSALGRPLSFALVRVRATAQLARLDAAARKVEVAGAFLADAQLEGRRVLLVDDVHTTGATLRAAARAVEARGGHATAHVLAATPRG